MSGLLAAAVEARRALEQALAAPDGPLPPGWERVAAARTAVVLRSTAPPLCYAKLYLVRSRWERLKALLRGGGRGQRAARASAALRRAGLCAPAVLACGRLRGYEYVVTEGVRGERLSELLARTAASTDPELLRLRRAALWAVGREVGRLHAAGFVHGDLRATNVVLEALPPAACGRPAGGEGGGEEGAPARWRVWFIDNERTRRPVWRRGHAALVNLHQLDMTPPEHASRTDRLRLWLGYLEGRGGTDWAVAGRTERRRLRAARDRVQARRRLLRAALVQALQRRVLARTARRQERRRARWLLEKAPPGRGSGGGGDGRAPGRLRLLARAPGLSERAIRAALLAHCEAVARGQPERGLIKADRTTRVSRVVVPAQGAVLPRACQGRELVVAVKEFCDRGWWRGLVQALVPHRGLVAWRGAQALAHAGFQTPEPLALLEWRRRGAVREVYLLARWAERAEELHLYLERRFAGNPRAPLPGPARGTWPAAGAGRPREPLGPGGEAAAVRACARLLARLHRAGIYHRDLKLPNILVEECAPPRHSEGSAAARGVPAGWRFWLLDLDSLRLGWRLSWRRRVKNLAQLGDRIVSHLPQVKRTHLVRFLRAYCEAEPGWKGQWRELFCAVAGYVRWYQARRARRARAR